MVVRAMISGEPVTVLSPVGAGEDEYGQPVREWLEAQVDDVLVCGPSTEDVGSGLRTDSGHPDGDAVSLTLHFPKTYTAPLRGCRVALRGKTFDVLGDPVALTAANVPGRWDRAVPVRLVEG